MLFNSFKKYFSHYQGLPFSSWCLIILTFLNSFSIGINFFMILYFTNFLHINLVNSGFLVSVYGFGTIVGGILGGKFSDFFRPIKISIVTLFCQSSCFFFLAKLKDFNSLALIMFLLGLTAYVFKVSNNLCILESCKEKKELRLKAVNINYSALNLGLAFSGALIGFFTNYNFKVIFYISTLVLFFCGLCLVLNINRHFKENLNQNNMEEITNQRKDLNLLILTLICIFFVGLIIAQLSSTYPVYLQKTFFNWGSRGISFLFLLDTFLIVFFQTHFVNLFKNFEKIKVVGFGAFLMSIGMLVLAGAQTFFGAIISCVLWAFGEMLFISLSQLICYEESESKRKGQTLGLFQSVYALSIILGPSLGTWIYKIWGPMDLWLSATILAFLCSLLCLFYKKIFWLNEKPTF